MSVHAAAYYALMPVSELQVSVDGFLLHDVLVEVYAPSQLEQHLLLLYFHGVVHDAILLLSPGLFVSYLNVILTQQILLMTE